MPNEVIAQIHQLSTTEENYDGIVFTDLAGKQLSEQFENEDTDDIRSNTAKDWITENVNDGNEGGNTIISWQSKDADNTTNEDILRNNNATHNQDMDDDSLNRDEDEYNTEEINNEYAEDPY